MKIRSVVLSLTILCFAVAAFAGTTTFYNDGGIDGNDNGFFISGPNNPNPAGSIQDISNGFISAASGAPNMLSFGEWVFNGATPTSIGYELGTSAFGTDLGSGTVALNSGNSVFLFTNGFGFDIYDVTIPVSSLAMTAGNEYWVSLSNATDSLKLEFGSVGPTRSKRRSCDLQLPAERHQLWRLRTRRGILHAHRRHHHRHDS